MEIMNMSNDLFISEGKRKNLREKANDASQKRCNTLICVLENPSNMQNIGAIIRNINSLGVAKLYVVDEKNIFKNKSWSEMRTADTLNNTSVSAIKWTFVKVFKSSKECFDYLEKNNFTSFGTSPHIKGKINVSLDQGIFTQKKLAVWFGTETSGMSDYAINKCANLIQIPMAGIIESFNLSVSTGIVLYEITKQRRNYKKE
jgi:tRNA (guanosine-2'-O-)-methyltransferase